jgi:hypothetical protein
MVSGSSGCGWARPGSDPGHLPKLAASAAMRFEITPLMSAGGLLEALMWATRDAEERRATERPPAHRVAVSTGISITAFWLPFGMANARSS